MLEHLHVEDYQILGKIDIDIGRFTVLVGPSGRGKTSTVRALRSLCLNQTPKRFLRHKKRKARVVLTLDGGQTIEWEKTADKGAVYAMGDQEFTRTGRAVPEPIQKLLGIRRIEIDKGVSFTPQFSLQFDLPLLLTESSTLAARALAQLTKLRLLVEGQVECRRDKIREERQRTSAEEDADRSREELGELPKTKRAVGAMNRAKKMMNAAAGKLETAIQANDIAKEIAGSLLVADMTLPSEEETQALEERLKRLEAASAAVQESEAADGALAEARDRLATAETTLQETQVEHDTLVEQLGACPLCGSTETWGHDHD